MTDEYANSEPDSPDPIAQAFRNYQRAPKDTVPRHVPDNLPPITAGPGQYSATEITEDGVTHVEAPAWIAKPFMPQNTKEQDQ